MSESLRPADASGALSPDAVVAAGGLALASAAVEASDRLDAVTFSHPALPGRAMVRLVPASTAAAVVTELHIAGFAESARTDSVARARRRALGFPAWALVHDPKNARYALEVMKDFIAARKRIATKPGHARDAFVAVADRLGRAAPHFLPSFWEEAGRAFVVGGAIAMATSAFEKARAAERTHGLLTGAGGAGAGGAGAGGAGGAAALAEEDRRADAFVEFALAGALSVKSLLAWPAELAKTRGPDVAFERLFDLAARRTLGGRAPWASLPKDLRAFAKAAKRDPVAEEARFVRAVLGCAAIARAPTGFWTAVADSVATVATDPVVAERLAWLFPSLADEDDGAEAWIGLLSRWGVLARLEAGELCAKAAPEGAPEDGAAPTAPASAATRKDERTLAAWVGKALVAWDDAPVALTALVTRLAPRLVAGGVPVRVFPEDVWRVVSVAAYEALLAAGVPVAAAQKQDEGSGNFDLGRWASGPGPHLDPVHIAAHPLLGPVLVRSVENDLDEDAFQALAVGKSAFREPRRAHLVATLADAARGGLLDFDTVLEELEGKVPASTRAEFPEEARPLAALDVAEVLARTLAGGVLDELGWPALDAAVTELTGAGKDVDLALHALAPWAVLTDGRRARVLGPAGQEHARDLKLPKDAEPTGFRWVGGQLLVAWRDPSDWSARKGYWSGAPKTIHTLDWESEGWREEEDVATPAWSGGGSASGAGAPAAAAVVSGTRLLRAGDTFVGTRAAFCDAEGAWIIADHVLRAVDLTTGALGPVDAPAFLAPRDGVAPRLLESRYLPQPVADSPLGGAGQYGWAAFSLAEVEDPDAWLARHAPRALHVPGGDEAALTVGLHVDGRAVALHRTPTALVAWPGTDAPRLVAEDGWSDYGLVAPDGAMLAKLESDALPWRGGSPVPLPLGLWHHLRPRDPAASAALRAIDADAARRLLALAAEAAVAADNDDEAAATALAGSLRAVLPVTSDALARGVAGVVLHARALADRLDAYRGGAAAEEAGGPNDEALRAALLGLCPSWCDEDGSALHALRTASAFLEGGDGKVAVSGLPWHDFLHQWGAILFVACSPVTTAEERATLTELLATLADSAFARGLPVRHVRVQVPRAAAWLHWETQWGDRAPAPQWTHVDGPNRYVVTHVEDDEDLVTLDLLEAAGTAAAPAAFRDLPGMSVVASERPVATGGAPGGGAPGGTAAREGDPAAVRIDGPFVRRILDAPPALPVGDAVYTVISAATGLTRGEAAAVWAGLRQMNRWGNDPLGKPARDALGLKLAEAKAARDTLAGAKDVSVREALHRAMVGWDPADPAALPVRVGAAWAAVFGTRAPVDPALLARARADFPGDDPAIALAEVAGIAHAAVFHADGDWILARSGITCVPRAGAPTGAGPAAFDGEALTRGVASLVWVYANTPGEDPLRANLPALYAALSTRVAHPGFLLPVVTGDDKTLTKWFARFDGAPFSPKRDPDDDDDTKGKDGGGLVASFDGDTVTVAVRPGKLDAGLVEEVSRLVKLDGNYEDSAPWRALLLLPKLGALAADAAPGWPQDPRRSAPDLVAEAAAHLTVDPDAAAAYLQLLALYNPTRANVLAWNGWKPAAYTAAMTTLVTKKLLVEAKRARAGRDHFLPGGWHERRSGSLPLEEWKLSLYDTDTHGDGPLSTTLPLTTFAALFRAAWARVKAGKGPRYERAR